MKINKLFSILLLLAGLAACTDTFKDINTRPDVFYTDEVSGKFFMTNPQFKLYGPDRYPYWRAQLIHADRYAGHFCFGHSSSWWSGELGYSYHTDYTDATWGWMEGYLGNLDNFMKLVDTGGEFENEYMYAMGLIIKGLYYQMYTDIFGMVPYAEAADPNIVTPKFDTQKTIYAGIIASLDKAMEIIGDKDRTGVGVDDAGDNDIYYKGDLQKWKRMANTLKLRIALRAYGAEGNDFSEAAIAEALAAPLLSSAEDNCLMEKDNVISQWGSASYGDIWYGFGAGSDWTVSKVLIDYLRDENDPRLSKYAKQAVGDTIQIEVPDSDVGALFDKRYNFIVDGLLDAGAEFDQWNQADTLYFIDMPASRYYIGQPSRLSGKIQSYAQYNLYSTPAEIIIQEKNKGEKIAPEIVMLTAEAYFLQAEAIVRGLSTGNADELYKEGIRQAMAVWGVSGAEAGNYLANSPLGALTGNQEEKLEKIAIQRWIAAYTDGFEAWAVVRDFGYPAELAAGVSDVDIYGLGDINGKYPQRMQYGSDTYNKNGANTDAAVAIQGPDQQDTKLWWAK